MISLSIIVNMYNTAKFMPKCIDSLLEQDIPAEEYEIIFVDDCSPDNSLAMAMEYQNRGKRLEVRGGRCPRIKVCHHEVNKGLAGGRNTGVDAAEGQYLCFVDPDDYIEKNSLAALLKQMDEEQLDMLRFNYQKVDEDYNNVADSPEEAAFDYSPGVMTGKEFLANRLGIACYVWAWMYRTALIKGDEAMRREARGEYTPIAHSQSPIAFIEGIYFDDTPWLPRVLQRAERVACACVPIAYNPSPITSHLGCPRHQYYLQRGGSMVHTVNPEAIRRKTKGQLDLLRVIVEHKKEADEMCRGWYNRMISHTVVNMLTSIAPCGYFEARNNYNQICSVGAFPLSPYKATTKTRRKVILLNICPHLFLIVLTIKLSIINHQ